MTDEEMHEIIKREDEEIGQRYKDYKGAKCGTPDIMIIEEKERKAKELADVQLITPDDIEKIKKSGEIEACKMRERFRKIKDVLFNKSKQ